MDSSSEDETASDIETPTKRKLTLESRYQIKKVVEDNLEIREYQRKDDIAHSRKRRRVQIHFEWTGQRTSSCDPEHEVLIQIHEALKHGEGCLIDWITAQIENPQGSDITRALKLVDVWKKGKQGPCVMVSLASNSPKYGSRRQVYFKNKAWSDFIHGFWEKTLQDPCETLLQLYCASSMYLPVCCDAIEKLQRKRGWNVGLEIATFKRRNLKDVLEWAERHLQTLTHSEISNALQYACELAAYKPEHITFVEKWMCYVDMHCGNDALLIVYEHAKELLLDMIAVHRSRESGVSASAIVSLQAMAVKREDMDLLEALYVRFSYAFDVDLRQTLSMKSLFSIMHTKCIIGKLWDLSYYVPGVGERLDEFLLHLVPGCKIPAVIRNMFPILVRSRDPINANNITTHSFLRDVAEFWEGILSHFRLIVAGIIPPNYWWRTVPSYTMAHSIIWGAGHDENLDATKVSVTRFIRKKQIQLVANEVRQMTGMVLVLLFTNAYMDDNHDIVNVKQLPIELHFTILKMAFLDSIQFAHLLDNTFLNYAISHAVQNVRNVVEWKTRDRNLVELMYKNRFECISKGGARDDDE